MCMHVVYMCDAWVSPMSLHVNSVGHQEVERKVPGKLVVQMLGELPENSTTVSMTPFTQNL